MVHHENVMLLDLYVASCEVPFLCGTMTSNVNASNCICHTWMIQCVLNPDQGSQICSRFHLPRVYRVSNCAMRVVLPELGGQYWEMLCMLPNVVSDMF